jgi:signal transduction histidine kinase
MAAGRQTGPIPISRADELGRLATSFSSMTGQVREAWQRLEEKGNERTRELHETLRQLQDTQETLVRREKAAMLGQLAAGVGHELRNPLGVMSNAIYYLDFVLTDARPDVRDYLRILREQVTLSTKIVTDLLDSARISPANRRLTSVHSIVGAQVERLPRADHVQVDVAVSEELPQVDVDPVHIGQAVYNLLTNATQAMGDSGGRIEVRAEPHGDDVALRIQDTGPGMSADVLERIFEPLFTTKARGIGLGLSVSRALVQANGGDISVWSEPGRGAIFTVTIPVTPRVTA